MNVKGIIFDYGGTIDSRGVHWSEIIWQGYCKAGFDSRITKEQFRDAYVHGERELARVRHILPCDTFLDILVKKVNIQRAYLAANGLAAPDQAQMSTITSHCYESARECIAEARPVLECLAERYPMVLVSIEQRLYLFILTRISKEREQSRICTMHGRKKTQQEL